MPTVLLLSVTPPDTSSVLALTSAVKAHQLLKHINTASTRDTATSRALVSEMSDILKHADLIRAWARCERLTVFETADLSDPDIQRRICRELLESAVFATPRRDPPPPETSACVIAEPV